MKGGSLEKQTSCKTRRVDLTTEGTVGTEGTDHLKMGITSVCFDISNIGGNYLVSLLL